jgi:hypothetical protein
MKKYFLLMLVVFLTFVAFVTCKKDDKLTNLEMLMAHKWKFSKWVQTKGTNVQDRMNIDNCSSDDIYEFLSGTELTVNFSTLKCTAHQPDTESINYTLNTNQDSIYPGTNADPIFIKSINLDKMEWESRWDEEGTPVVVNLEMIEDK